jgi:hypothetical protein
VVPSTTSRLPFACYCQCQRRWRQVLAKRMTGQQLCGFHPNNCHSPIPPLLVSLVGAMCAAIAADIPAVDALARGMAAARLSVQVCRTRVVSHRIYFESMRVPPRWRAVGAGSVTKNHNTEDVCSGHRLLGAASHSAKDKRSPTIMHMWRCIILVQQFPIGEH